MECESSRDCPAGARCVAASDGWTVCLLPEDEDCDDNSDCPAPLVCAADGECRNECRTDRDCVMGQICTTSHVCAEPDEVDENGNLIVAEGAGGASGTGTVLDGNHPGNTDSRLVSPTVELPSASGQTLPLRFWNWFSMGDDTGQVQITVWDDGTSTWGAWENVDTAVTGSSETWTLKAVDLTAYAGERVRIGFFHNADNTSVFPGWYVDDLSFVLL